MQSGSCTNRAESSKLDDKSKSLVLVNYFESVPVKQTTCVHNSGDLVNMAHTCYSSAGNRWANFVAVDYYKVYVVAIAVAVYLSPFTKNGFALQRSEGGGSFQAVDTLNGRLLCGCDDVHACAVRFALI